MGLDFVRGWINWVGNVVMRKYFVAVSSQVADRSQFSVFVVQESVLNDVVMSVSQVLILRVKVQPKVVSDVQAAAPAVVVTVMRFHQTSALKKS